MARRVFYSFQYDNDVMRVQQIRNIHSIDDESKPVTPTKWEEVKRGGDAAIHRWIDDNIGRASCVVVLVGQNTVDSKWVDYEIRKAWDDGKGLVGIYVHNLKDPNTGTCQQGKNPFENVSLKNGRKLSEYVQCYNPVSYNAYNDIAGKLEDLVEKAIANRQ